MAVVKDKIWRPHAKQEEFIRIPDQVFEGMYGGAAGGGKSELLLLLPIVRQFHLNPRFKGLLVRRTFPELEKSLILRSHEWYEPAGAKYNAQVRRWRFPSGAVIDFGYAEHEKDVRRYDTTEYNYIGIDELTSFSEFQYLYLTSRIRTSDESLPAFIRSATNPGNTGHGWVRKRFVEPAKDGGILLKDKKTGQYRIFIQAKLTDNPYLLKADPEYGRRLEMLPEAEKRAKLYGDWWTFSGQVFEEFRLQQFPDEPPNALHVIPSFTVPEWWPRILAVDWGFSAKTWAGWGAISPDARVYIYREYVAQKTKVSTWAADIARMSQFEKISHVVLDPSAWNQRGDEKTIHEQFQASSGFLPNKADNDRIGGKNLYHEFLRWETRPPRSIPKEGYNADLANRILRISGMDAYKDYLRSFEPEKPEVNLPRMQIFDICTELITCLPLCIYDDPDTVGKPSEDVKEFNGDDAYDGSRYLLKAVDHFINKSKKEFEKMQTVQQIVAKFENDKDMTSFYRKMEEAENKHKNNKGIKLYHGKTFRNKVRSL